MFFSEVYVLVLSNIRIMFKDYVESIKAKGDFVDTSNINNLKCEICDTEFFSEEEAVVHGSSLGHWNFKQL